MATSNGPSRDVSPAKTPHFDKPKAESYNKAANPPNDPTKDHQTTSYNPNNDYPCCSFHEDED